MIEISLTYNIYTRMEKFIEDRIEICKKCAIARMTEFGLKCDSRKYLNPETNEGSFFKKDGWIKGCGCLIPVKIKNLNNHCPANKW